MALVYCLNATMALAVLHFSRHVELEKARIQLEMKRLNAEEARSERKKRPVDMNRELKRPGRSAKRDLLI